MVPSLNNQGIHLIYEICLIHLRPSTGKVVNIFMCSTSMRKNGVYIELSLKTCKCRRHNRLFCNRGSSCKPKLPKNRSALRFFRFSSVLLFLHVLSVAVNAPVNAALFVCKAEKVFKLLLCGSYALRVGAAYIVSHDCRSCFRTAAS